MYSVGGVWNTRHAGVDGSTAAFREKFRCAAYVESRGGDLWNEFRRRVQSDGHRGAFCKDFDLHQDSWTGTIAVERGCREAMGSAAKILRTRGFGREIVGPDVSCYGRTIRDDLSHSR